MLREVGVGDCEEGVDCRVEGEFEGDLGLGGCFGDEFYQRLEIGFDLLVCLTELPVVSSKREGL